jgi:hypothetical protein
MTGVEWRGEGGGQDAFAERSTRSSAGRERFLRRGKKYPRENPKNATRDGDERGRRDVAVDATTRADATTPSARRIPARDAAASARAVVADARPRATEARRPRFIRASATRARTGRRACDATPTPLTRWSRDAKR